MGKNYHNIVIGSLPDWLEKTVDKEPEEDDINSFTLLTPTASASNHGIFEVFPSLSFDSVASEDPDGTSLDVTASKLQRLERNLHVLKEKLTRPFTDIEASYLALIQDVSKVNDRVKKLRSSIGQRLPINGQSSPSVWSALGFIATSVESCQQKSVDCQHVNTLLTDDLLHTREELAALQDLVSALDHWKHDVDAMMDIFHKRFQHIKPFISSLSRSSPTLRSTPSRDYSSTDELLQRISALEKKN